MKKRRAPLRKNPAFTDLTPLGRGMLLGMILPSIESSIGSDIVTGMAYLARGIANAKASKSASECTCKGECTCHMFAQIGGQPCPPDCKNYGNHFDGCHRCDPQCQSEEPIQ